MEFNLLATWNELAINQYHVNPKIFIFLMIFSVPFYYLGWLGLISAVIDFGKRYANKKTSVEIVDIFTGNKFIFSLLLNRIAWVLPYIYVIGWGRDIPWWFWLLFVGWIIFSSYLFWNKLKHRIRGVR